MSTEKPLYTFYKQWGNNILFKYRKNGKSYSKKIDFYKPSLFVKENGATDARSIFGYGLRQKQFESIKAAKEFAEQYKHVAGMTVEGNADFANQFITEFYEGKMPEFIFDDIRMGILDIEVRSPDGFPEPAEARYPINGVTFYDSFTKTYYTYGDKPYIHDSQCKHVGKLNVVYQLCRDEIDLLEQMLNHFVEFQYDITTGWNSEFFDMPYIVQRCYNILGKQRTDSSLSPFNNIRIKEVVNDFGQLQIKVDIMGLPHVDYLELYKKHNFEPRESYRLDFIASVELDRNKVTYEEEGSLVALYDTNPQDFYTYNIIDVDIVKSLEDKLGFMYITYILAYFTMSNYVDTLKTVKPWENLIAKHLHCTGRVPPYHRKSQIASDVPFEGAFVHPTQIGHWKWLMAIDLNSLYPMNEIQYGIGVETHIPVDMLPEPLRRIKSTGTIEQLIAKTLNLDVLKEYNVAMTANFEFYDKSVSSSIAEIKDGLYVDRKSYKRKMLDFKAEAQAAKSSDPALYDKLMKLSVLNKNIQQSLKILLNGGYGAVGNEGFLYYKLENAEAITTSGKLINKWTHERINALLNKMCGTTGVNFTIAGDTDSLYLCLDLVVKKAGISHLSDNEITDWIDNFHKTILDPVIKKWTEELCDYMNGVKNKMVWGREAIASDAVFVRKKGYTMRVIDSEGVRFSEPEIKIVGLEAIKAAAVPEWARTYLKECYEIGLTGTEKSLQARVAEMRTEFMAFDVSTIATPRGASLPSKYKDPDNIYVKGTPKHIKAVLVHNWLVDKLGLTNIQKIGDGSKIKYIELKRPNPIEQDVIGFSWFFPKEFGLEKYVDRNTIFDSSFIAPLEIFLAAIKWGHEPIVSLEDFFS